MTAHAAPYNSARKPLTDMKNSLHPRILLIGTGDTKADELIFMQRCIDEAGGETATMDISILGDPPYKAQYDKRAVAAAADQTIEGLIASGDENSSMTLMALGASRHEPPGGGGPG